MYPPDYDPDPSTCSGCGVEMEVIGPPGPRHRDGCPFAPKPSPPLSPGELRALYRDPLGRAMIDADLVELTPEARAIIEEMRRRG